MAMQRMAATMADTEQSCHDSATRARDARPNHGRTDMRVTCSFPPLPFPVTLCSSHSIVAVARFVSSEFVSSNSRSDLCDALACAPPLSRRTGEHTRKDCRFQKPALTPKAPFTGMPVSPSV